MAHSQSRDEHVERARQIADALDSSNRERTLHQQFYDEFKAWEAEDPDTHSMKAFDRAIGRGNDYTRRIVRFVTGGADRATPFDDGRTERGEATPPKTQETAERFVENLKDAPPEVIETIAQGAREVAEKRYQPPQERERRRKEADTFAKDRVQPIIDEASKNTVVLSLENALEELQEVSSLTAEEYDRIRSLTSQIDTEAEVKRAMAGVR